MIAWRLTNYNCLTLCLSVLVLLPFSVLKQEWIVCTLSVLMTVMPMMWTVNLFRFSCELLDRMVGCRGTQIFLHQESWYSPLLWEKECNYFVTVTSYASVKSFPSIFYTWSSVFLVRLLWPREETHEKQGNLSIFLFPLSWLLKSEKRFCSCEFGVLILVFLQLLGRVANLTQCCSK